jgi:hypothetical protein
MTNTSREALSNTPEAGSLNQADIRRINAITKMNLQDPSLQSGVKSVLGHLHIGNLDKDLTAQDISRIMSFQRQNNTTPDGII